LSFSNSLLDFVTRYDLHFIYAFFNIQKEEDSFHQQIGPKLKEETRKVLHLLHSFVMCWNLDISESRWEMSGKFWNVVLEKDGESHRVKGYPTLKNSVALVRERTIPTERPPPVGEVSANFKGFPT